MVITEVIQQKGGVGKTGLTVGTGGALAERGRRMLLGDADPQGHLTVSALQMQHSSQDAPSLAVVLAGDFDGSAKNLVVRPSTTANGGVLDVVPTSLRMFIAARNLDKRPDQERQLGHILDELTSDYDHILLDAPPVLDILPDNILACADGTLTPVQPDDSLIEALRNLFSQVRNLEWALRRAPVRLHGLVPSNFRRPLSLIDKSVMQSLQQLDGVPIPAELPWRCWSRRPDVPVSRSPPTKAAGLTWRRPTAQSPMRSIATRAFPSPSTSKLNNRGGPRMSKNVGSASNLADFNDAMASRYTDPKPQSPPAESQPAQPQRQQKDPQQRKPAMTRRSWLLPTEVGDGLAEAANRIHHGSGGQVSKSEAQAAIIRAGLAQEDEIARELNARSTTDRT